MLLFYAIYWLLCLSAVSQPMDSATMTFIGDISKASPPAVVGAFVCCKSGKLADCIMDFFEVERDIKRFAT